MPIAPIGIDLGQTSFHLIALGEHYKVLKTESTFRGEAELLSKRWEQVAI
jgi:hypothetical protein